MCIEKPYTCQHRCMGDFFPGASQINFKPESNGVVVVCRRPTFMETLRWDNFCNFGATLLRFGTLFTNIILLGSKILKKIGPPQRPKKPKNHKKRHGFSRWDNFPTL